MAAQALYLKYRPMTFDEVIGQEPITRTLRNALRQDRIRHAYLFAGPRGTGKTTTARLLAKAVNCRALEGERPCNACSICVAVNQGRFLDLIEIDAASNRGIDEIRDIREKVNFRPNEGRYKVYVLDEAHMLTEPAFNALLKTLEEPPPHVIFALVTTDPHKIPATIASRCQRFDFRRLPLQAIVDRLAYISREEGVAVQPAALELIAYQGTGAMRDAISLLDQLASYGDEISLDQVQTVLGTGARDVAGQLVASVAGGDVAGGLELIDRVVGDGTDPRQFGREVVEYLRGLLLIREGAGTRLLHATAEQAAEMEAISGQISSERLVQAIRLFNEAAADLKSGLQSIPQLPLELALVESILQIDLPVLADESGHQPEAVTPTSPAAPAAEPQPWAKRVAERPAPAPVSPSAVPSEPPAKASVEAGPATSPAESPPRPDGATSAPSLSLQQVAQAWDQVLQAVRQRNPAAEGALRSGCEPVEVDGNQIVVTFPYPFLQEKLGNPQRRTEIQDALDEVLHAECRLRLVLASEYEAKRSQPSTPVASARESLPSPSLGPQALDEISRWAEERGGEAKLVQP